MVNRETKYIWRADLPLLISEGNNMSRYSEKIIELLRTDHPDLSAWTIICASERAVDPVQYLIHSELGGILPESRRS